MDVRLLGGVLLVALALWGVGRLLPHAAGRTVVVSENGAETRYPLAVDRTVELPGNHVCISDGQVRVVWADCPDLICAAHAPIDTAGETIVCLPHRVAIRIE